MNSKYPSVDEVDTAILEDTRSWIATYVMGYKGVGWYRRKSKFNTEWELCNKLDATLDMPLWVSSLYYTPFEGNTNHLTVVPDYFTEYTHDFYLFLKIRKELPPRFLHKFFDYLHDRLSVRGEYTHDYGQQNIRHLVSYRPGDFAVAALKTKLEILREQELLEEGRNPYPVGVRYDPPPLLPNLILNPGEVVCEICKGSGREQLTDLTIDVCLPCHGSGKVKKE